ncbi:MAG: N-formylglutamate deformylase [Pseudomonadota bacterium]
MTDTTHPSFSLLRGSAPLLVSVPHSGTALPEAIRQRLVPRASAVEDTDWHLGRLYAFAHELGASLIVPKFSRYVIDLNRPREDTLMYPGVNNTGLVPTRFFSGDALYPEGQEPDAAEIARRVEHYWQPYHAALAAEQARLRAAHGHALLFDAHSIKSELPWLFQGTLPHLNLGTAGGGSCAPTLTAALGAVLGAQTRYGHVTDGRFKGGYITRRFGRPAEQLHAVQLEMCWRCYLDESRPSEWHAERASEVMPVLRALVQTMIDWRP